MLALDTLKPLKLATQKGRWWRVGQGQKVKFVLGVAEKGWDWGALVKIGFVWMDLGQSEPIWGICTI